MNKQQPTLNLWALWPLVEELRDQRLPLLWADAARFFLRNLLAQSSHVASQNLREKNSTPDICQRLFWNLLSLGYLAKASAWGQGLSNTRIMWSTHLKCRSLAPAPAESENQRLTMWGVEGRSVWAQGTESAKALRQERVLGELYTKWAKEKGAGDKGVRARAAGPWGQGQGDWVFI